MFTGVIKLAQIDDYITPSQSCIQPKIMKPDQAQQQKATVTLNDCLACSGCITSAQSVLIQQMSITKFMQFISQTHTVQGCSEQSTETDPIKQPNGQESQSANLVICIMVSPQSLLSLAKQYQTSVDQFMHLFESWLTKIFSNVHFIFLSLTTAIEICHRLIFEEFITHFESHPQKQILCSECPGWVCYAEKTLTSQVTDLMSEIKSPQQILGGIIRRKYGRACKIVGIMPCYDKKLEAIRFEVAEQLKEVDLVLATTEIVELIASLSRQQSCEFQPMGTPPYKLSYKFTDPITFAKTQQISFLGDQTSNGYIDSILQQLSIKDHQVKQIRNPDFIEHSCTVEHGGYTRQLKMAKCYGFRNIQKIVQAVRKGKCQYAYVEIMACPGGCFSGGGQIRHEGLKHKQIIAEFKQSVGKYPEKASSHKEHIEQQDQVINGNILGMRVKYRPIEKSLEQSVMNW